MPRIRRDPLAFLAGLVERHGDLVAFPMPRTPVLLVNTPAGARHVLLEAHRTWTKATIQYGALSAVTGAGLLTADGDTYRAHRPVLQPAFRHGELAALAGPAVAGAARLRSHWESAPGGVLDADHAVGRTMLGVVGRTLFGADLDPVAGRLVGAVDAALRLVVARAASPVPTGWRTPSARRLARRVAVVDGVVDQVIGARRADGGRGDGGVDVLGLLLAARDAGLLDDREVRDEVVTMVVAGHETVASALAWTLHLLAGHPQVATAVDDELHAVVGDRRPPEWGDLAGLRLLRAVVDEALRLYPPAWVVTRRATAPDRIEGVDVPAGTLVIVSPWLLHRRPDSWPEPDRFDPGRFLVGDGEGRGAAPRGEYLPFGVGPRLCIGRDVALAQAVLVLATLLRGRRVRRPDGAPPVSVDALVTLRPRGGLPLRLARPGPSGGVR